MTVSDAERVIARLRRAGWTLATCESLTGGMIGAALTSVAGASAVYRGGFVTYASDLKAAWAGVDADLIAQRGVINAETATQMARGARARAAADLAVACTGVAGPDPQDGAEPGTVHIAVAGPGNGVHVRQLALTGGRAAIRSQTVDGAFALLLEVLGE